MTTSQLRALASTAERLSHGIQTVSDLCTATQFATTVLVYVNFGHGLGAFIATPKAELLRVLKGVEANTPVVAVLDDNGFLYVGD